ADSAGSIPVTRSTGTPGPRVLGFRRPWENRSAIMEHPGTLARSTGVTPIAENRSEPPAHTEAAPPASRSDAAEEPPSALAHARRFVQRQQPSKHLTQVLDLHAEADGVAATRQEIMRRVEGLTGMRLGEIEALAAVAAGAKHH